MSHFSSGSKFLQFPLNLLSKFIGVLPKHFPFKSATEWTSRGSAVKKPAANSDNISTHEESSYRYLK